MKNKKLQLNKETIAKLNDDSMSMVRGGGLAKGIPKAGFWTFEGKCTDGCTDGCGDLATIWNCTKTNCSDDCKSPSVNICTSHETKKSVTVYL